MPLIILIFYIAIEIALFIWIGGLIGVGWTILWTLAGFAIGAFMLRKGGRKSREWLEAASRGQKPERISAQLFWYIGGLLVVLPGFFTDFMGALLVFPPTQKFILWIGSFFVPEFVQVSYSAATNISSSEPMDNDKIIEGEAVEISQSDVSSSGKP